MFQNAVEFLKLEKVEYSGIKGRMLSAQTVAIFEEFNEMYKTFQEVTYDPLDPQDTVNDLISQCVISFFLLVSYRKLLHLLIKLLAPMPDVQIVTNQQNCTTKV